MLFFQNILCYGLPGSIFLFFDFLAISKHPMLQFTFPCFLINIILICYFKTSYVTVYHGLSLAGRVKCQISKHPMLRFTQRLLQTYIVLNFKTFYVTVYLLISSLYSKRVSDFKTSYVTVYLLAISQSPGHAVEFQNILCYGLPPNFSICNPLE